MAYVYRHIRLDKNEPFYIGIGGSDNYKRAFTVRNRNNFWKNIVSKTEYEVEILIDDLDYNLALEKEKEFISLYGRKDLGNGILVNLTDGGQGQKGIIRGDSYKQKLKENAKNRWANPEFKEKMKESLKGKHSNYVTSEETRKKISLALKGRKGKPCSEETKEKLRQYNLGKKHSEETKLKCKEISLKMWQEEEKAKFIKEKMKGTQERAKIKRNDIS